MSNYVTKKDLEYTTGAGASDLAAKKNFIALKAEVDKLDINKLINVPTSLNNLKTKIDDFDVGELKTVAIDLKRLNNALDKKAVKKTVYNKLNTKVNKFLKKFLMQVL